MRQDDETFNAIVSMIENPDLVECLKDQRNIDLMNKLAGHPDESDYLVKNIHDISEIVQDAKDAARKRQEENEHKNHIKLIGQNIQDEILSHLQGVKLSDTSKINDEQGGQDFKIIQDGKEVYYIEVEVTME